MNRGFGVLLAFAALLMAVVGACADDSEPRPPVPTVAPQGASGNPGPSDISEPAPTVPPPAPTAVLASQGSDDGGGGKAQLALPAQNRIIVHTAGIGHPHERYGHVSQVPAGAPVLLQPRLGDPGGHRVLAAPSLIDQVVPTASLTPAHEALARLADSDLVAAAAGEADGLPPPPMCACKAPVLRSIREAEAAGSPPIHAWPCAPWPHAPPVVCVPPAVVWRESYRLPPAVVTHSLSPSRQGIKGRA